jgi:hypothetical protein
VKIITTFELVDITLNYNVIKRVFQRLFDFLFFSNVCFELNLLFVLKKMKKNRL